MSPDPSPRGDSGLGTRLFSPQLDDVDAAANATRARGMWSTEL
jgi:hypothetical protein